MKTKHIALSILFIIAYLIGVIVLYLKLEIPKELMHHFIFCILGMICLLILNKITPSLFVRFFTITAIIFYVFTSFGSICYSIVKNDLSAFQNLGPYARTETFLFASVFCFLVYDFWKRKHKQ